MAFKSPFSLHGMQLGHNTPQNNVGLGLPGGKAMFNLPRFQMPGTTVNFGGGIGGGGQGGPSALQLSITRTASSNPIQNILNDISNPLGGTNIGIGPQQQAPQRGFGMTGGASPTPSWPNYAGAGLDFPIPNHQQSGFLRNPQGFMSGAIGGTAGPAMMPGSGMNLRNRLTSMAQRFGPMMPFPMF